MLHEAVPSYLPTAFKITWCNVPQRTVCVLVRMSLEIRSY